MVKKYRLLKDLPECPKGSELTPIRDGKSYMTTNKKYSWGVYEIENNPMWFELIEE